VKHGFDKEKRPFAGCNKKLFNEHPPLNNRSNRLTWPNEGNKTDAKTAPTSKKDEERPTGNGKRPLGAASGCLERVLCHEEAEVMNRANQIVMYVPAGTSYLAAAPGSCAWKLHCTAPSPGGGGTDSGAGSKWSPLTKLVS